ncbi:hypothetical protein [Helicobacter sp. L8]|uniref:hypothetical protein n=1 Tax=Helicobacter sp. L8 TaxID=2316078 RepID=UPI000EB3C56C|nr:hypothetical protein [Helicobacter sp. L8]
MNILDRNVSFYEAVEKLKKSRKKWQDTKIAIVMVDPQDAWMIAKHRDLHNGFYEKSFTWEDGGINHPTFFND